MRRLDLYESAAPFPAIYILQLHKPANSTGIKKGAQGVTEAIGDTGTRCALGPNAASPAPVSMVGKYIPSLRNQSSIDNTSIDNKCEVDGHPRWLRTPIKQLLAGAEEFLGSDLRVGGRRVRRASAA